MTTTNNTPAKPAFVLAPISPETAQNVGKGFAKAAAKVEGATRTLLIECAAVARLLPPLTAAQWDKQVAPSIRDAFKRSKAGLAETTIASYRSRFKTAGLAIASGLPELQPVAGETFPAYLLRVAEPLGRAKLADGRDVWPADKAKPGRAAGTSAPKTGGRDPSGSKGAADRAEGGMDERAPLAAALILTRQNMARAQRLAIVMQSYAEEFDRWTATILSDADKRELEAKVTPPAETPKAQPSKGRKAA